MSQANFTGATLHGACLAYADLSDANFSHAAFGATDIVGAILRGATFSGQSCFSLDFVLAESLVGCVYRDGGDVLHSLACPPIVIRGAKAQPMILFQDRSIVVQVPAHTSVCAGT